MLFRAGKTVKEIPVSSYFVQVSMKDEIETVDGWKHFSELKIGDKLSDGEEVSTITDIVNNSVADGVATIYLDEEVVV